MKLKTHQVPGWWTLSLCAFVVILGLIAAAAVASAQESKPAEKATTPAIVPAESAEPTTTKPEIDAKIPDAIQSLMPSIVTVTRIEPSDGAAATKPVSHAGIVVDPRGYIVAPLLPSQSRLKQFVVRLANQKEFVGELVGSDETLKLGVLKIESPQPLVAVSLAKIREAQVGNKVLLVTSPASKERFSGRVTSTTVDFGNENSPKFLQTDIAFPLSEYGSLMVSELGEPIGIFMASRPGEPPVSMATPLKLAMKLIDATTNPESKADAERPVFAVGLEPATLLFKQVVELFGPRGMKVTAFEEGKTLKIEATPKEVVEDLNNLLELVAQELRKQAEPGSKPSAEKSSAVSLEPATPLAKSLVELFGPRGAKVLDFEAGKRLKVETPGDVLLDLEKMLKLVANEAQKQADLKRTLGQAQPSANEDVRVTGTPNESQPELASERLFHVRRNQTQLGGQRDGRTLAWVAVDPASSDVDNLKPGDVVDLVLPGDESFVVLDSDQTYVPKFKSVIEHVLVEELQRPGNRREMGSNNRYVGLRLGIQIAPAEMARIQSVPTYHDLSNSTITHVVRLKHIRAEHLFDLLHRSFSNVVFENDVERNAIVLFWNLSSPIQGLMDAEAAIRKLDIPSTGLAVESTASRGLPDTPDAKQLVEQLHAQESAAAAEAATIRQLQANGQAEQNRQPIAEHQRKLKNLLTTAFDLKLQLEELQVKELQSRLSRLERQIGQRKELREKIIERRSHELIEGEALRWDSTRATAETPDTTTSKSQTAAPVYRDIESIGTTTQIGPPGQALPVQPTPANSKGGIAGQAASSLPPYQEFAKKLATMDTAVAEAEEALRVAERNAEINPAVDKVPSARRRLKEANRNRQAMQDEYAAILRDLELQIESAQAEVDAAKQSADRYEQLERDVGAQQETADAQLRLKQSTLTLERLKVQYDLYRKAGEVPSSDGEPLSKVSDVEQLPIAPENFSDSILAPLQGEWNFEQFTHNPATDKIESSGQGNIATIRNDQILLQTTPEDPKVLWGTIKAGEAGSHPQFIDLVMVERPDDDTPQVLPGILKVEGDVVQICHANSSSAPRPTVFEAGADAYLLTFKRRTPVPVSELEGDWHLVSSIDENGRIVETRPENRTFRSDYVTFVSSGGEYECRIKVNPDVKTIWYYSKEEDNSFTIEHYELKGEQLLLRDSVGREEVFERGHVRIPNVVSPATEEQKLRWRSALVEIVILSEPKSNLLQQQYAMIGHGVVVSSNGLILTQLKEGMPANSPLTAKFDGGSLVDVKIAEDAGNGLFALQPNDEVRINHFLPLGQAPHAVGDEVYVWGGDFAIGTATIVLTDRKVVTGPSPVWQISMPHDGSLRYSEPVLSAEGELAALTLMGTGDLTLAVPATRLKEMFQKTLVEQP